MPGTAVRGKILAHGEGVGALIQRVPHCAADAEGAALPWHLTPETLSFEGHSKEQLQLQCQIYVSSSC